MHKDVVLDFDLDKSEPVYVGQWIWYDTSKLLQVAGIAVNVPSFTVTHFKAGGDFDIGTERVTIHTQYTELERLVQKGLPILIQEVEKFGWVCGTGCN